MSDAKPEAHQNVCLQNVVTGATTNPVMQNPDAIDEEFIESANRVLKNAVELNPCSDWRSSIRDRYHRARRLEFHSEVFLAL
jgi:hypothetical protein